jgi:hypothetical protein
MTPLMDCIPVRGIVCCDFGTNAYSKAKNFATEKLNTMDGRRAKDMTGRSRPRIFQIYFVRHFFQESNAYNLIKTFSDISTCWCEFYVTAEIIDTLT